MKCTFWSLSDQSSWNSIIVFWLSSVSVVRNMNLWLHRLSHWKHAKRPWTGKDKKNGRLSRGHDLDI